MSTSPINEVFKETDAEIFKWIEDNQKVNFELELKKYYKLFDLLSSSGFKMLEAKASTKVMVVGAGEGRVEKQIINALDLSEVELWIIDPAKPKIETSDIISKLHWVREFVTPERPLAVPTDFDLLVCLGTSRYFHSAIDTYSSLIGHIRPGGLVVLDFLHLPPMRAATTRIMGHQLRQLWRENPQTALTFIEDLADISSVIYDRLSEASAEFRCSTAELGINAGCYSVQQLIYEFFFPFWCRPGFNRREIASQLLWGLMCKSLENPPEKIQRFVADQSLVAIENLQLNPDTRIIIATKSEN